MRVPFRIGATSFTFPDRWLPNVERLVGRVDDVEILLFEIGSEVPVEAELCALAEWKRRAGLTYTLHTPLDVSLASEDERRRRESVEMISRAIDIARPLNPEAMVVHVYLGDCERDTPPTDLGAWRRRATRSLETILARGVRAADLCVESLDYDFAHIEPVITDLGLSTAIDVGHLHRDGRPARSLLLRNLHRTRVIQWHGVDSSGRDHRSVAHYPRQDAQWLVGTLLQERYAGVLTLEVFREADLAESLAYVASLLADEAPQ